MASAPRARQERSDAGNACTNPKGHHPQRCELSTFAGSERPSTSFEFGGLRKWPSGIHHEHNQSIEIARAGTRYFHRRIRSMPGHELALVNLAHPVRSLLAELARQHVEGF